MEKKETALSLSDKIYQSNFIERFEEYKTEGVSRPCCRT